MEEKFLFKVVITAIVVKDGKFLITKRGPNEASFPSRWTVPGGKLSTLDYTVFPKDTPDYWYNVLERALRREVREEVGLEIKNIRYVTSLASADPGKNPSLVISCMADWAEKDVAKTPEAVDHVWVGLEEAKSFDLIEGIYDELRVAHSILAGLSPDEWVSAGAAGK